MATSVLEFPGSDDESVTVVVSVHRKPSAEEPSRPTQFTYEGPASGLLIWSGRIEAGQVLIIEGSSASFGALRGPELPGVPVGLDLDWNNFDVVEMPTQINDWKRMRLRCKSGTHGIVPIRWSVLDVE